MKRSMFRSKDIPNSSTGPISNVPIQLLYSRAFESVIWGMPAVNFERMYEAFIQDAKGSMNEVAHWSRISDWKNQLLTPNPDFIYFLPFFDTKQAGPMVLEIPAHSEGIIAGTINDCWQGTLAEIEHSQNNNTGNYYLILPPEYNESIPGGYIPIRSNYYQGYALLRSVLKSTNTDDVAAAVSHAKQIRLYPLSRAKDPPPTIFVDAADNVFDSTIQYDLRFFQALNKVVQYEPWINRDKVMIDILKTIGIEKGRLFRPNLRTQEILDEAANDAQAWFSASFDTSFLPYYEGRQWMKFSPPETIDDTGSKSENSDRYPVDQRGFLYAYGLSTTRQANQDCLSLTAVRDKVAELLDGSNEYRIKVPDTSTICQYWSLTVYDRVTRSFIRNQANPFQSSRNPGLQKNSNGSVDIYFSPESPGSKNSNWIATIPKTSLEICMRFYGPGKELLEKKWKLPDVERIG